MSVRDAERQMWLGGLRRRGALIVVLALCLVSGTAGARGATPPTIEGQSADAITGTRATLHAEIDPQEATGPGVYYQFQLAADPGEFSTELLCPAFLPPGFDACNGTYSATALPIGHLPAGTTARSVGLELQAPRVILKPGTTYHYRVIAAAAVAAEDTIEWSPPTVLGGDQTFTTPEPPTIQAESVSGVTANDATLQATINPHGAGATYRFELAKSPVCLPVKAPYMPCPHVETGALPTVSLPPGNLPIPVSLDLASAGVTLTPNWRYTFRLVASSAGGEAEGFGQSFTTQAIACPAASGPCGGEPCSSLTAKCFAPRRSRVTPWRYVGQLGRRTIKATVHVDACSQAGQSAIWPAIRERGRQVVITMKTRQQPSTNERPCEKLRRSRVLRVKLSRPLAGLTLYDGSFPKPRFRKRFPAASG